MGYNLQIATDLRGLSKMKKFTIISILVLFLATLAFNINAAVLPTTTTPFGATNPNFGSSAQEASNPDEDFNSTVTPSIQFKNDATAVTVNGIQVTYKNNFNAQDLELVLTSGATLFGTNGSGTETQILQFRARVPENLDAVNQNFEEVAVNVATVQLMNGTTAITGSTFEVFMQRENNLVINNADLSVSGDQEGLDNNDNVKDVKPGDTMELELELKNEFSDRSQIDVTMKDIAATVEINQGDLDIDEDQDVDDIDADNEDTVTLNFDIDEDADEDDYDMFIMAEGRDEHGAKHGEKWKVTLEVQREDHDVQMKRIQVIDVSPPSLVCGDEVRFIVLAENEGTKDEKNVFVTVRQTELGIDLRSDPFNVEDFNSRDNDFTVTLLGQIPKDAAKGNYIGEVKTLFNGGKDENSEFVQLNLGECKLVPKASAVLLQLPQTTFTAAQGKVFSLPLTLQNAGTETATYTVEVKPDTNWADTPTAQEVTVDAGQSTTLYAYLTPSLDSGSYTATVNVKQDNVVLKTAKVNVNLGVPTSPTGAGTYQPSVTLDSVWRNLANSTAFWIAAIVVIVALIIWILTVLVRPK